MFKIDIRRAVTQCTAQLDRVARKQVPFATAKTLTALGKLVQKAEQRAMPRVFDRPTPFTTNSIGVKAARKTDLKAIVYVRDIAASYLEPFEFGGKHKLIGSGRTWLNPKNGVQLNQYGNLSRSKLAQLKGRPDIFIGKVKTKSGEEIDGVWQRPFVPRVTRSGRRPGRVSAKANTTGRLKLLLRFGDAMPVRQRLGYRARGEAVVRARAPAEFSRALASALRSAR